MPKPPPVRQLFALLSLIACLALFSPALATAATVTNGDFETGNLNGWLTEETEGGNWMTYTSTTAPPETPAPPQGNFAAVTTQAGPGRHILYQDIPLEPGYTHKLSLIAYYSSKGEIASPPSLDPTIKPNQQYRIDIMKPSAALDSLNSGDILATLLATKTGDAEKLAPIHLEADLTAYAGQTVRLRLVEVDNKGNFFAGVDAVSITSTPPPPPPPSNTFTFGKPKLNLKKGTAKLPATVPGPGTLILAGKTVVKQSEEKAAAGTIKLLVKAKGRAKKKLNDTGKAKVKVTVTYTPTGGVANTLSKTLVLKKRLH